MKEVVKVKVISSTDDDFNARDRLFMNGKRIFRVGPLCECPEDAVIGRDLISCAEIADFLEGFLKDHQGKKVKFVYEDEEEEE